jgi:hypothetical protein
MRSRPRSRPRSRQRQGPWRCRQGETFARATTLTPLGSTAHRLLSAHLSAKRKRARAEHELTTLWNAFIAVCLYTHPTNEYGANARRSRATSRAVSTVPVPSECPSASEAPCVPPHPMHRPTRSRRVPTAPDRRQRHRSVSGRTSTCPRCVSACAASKRVFARSRTPSESEHQARLTRERSLDDFLRDIP